EALRRERWKEDGELGSGSPAHGLSSRAAYWMWRARASWRPAGTTCRVWLTWRRRGPRESWQLALESGADAPRAHPTWSVATEVLPGRVSSAAAEPTLEATLEATADPVAGIRWETSWSPARVSARLALPLHASGLAQAQIETRYATPSGKPRLELWLSVRGRLGRGRRGRRLRQDRLRRRS